jgi:hypothetical protein
MPRTRRKPLWRWEPFPYAVVLLLVIVTGTLRPDATPIAFWVLLSATVAAIVVFGVLLVRDRRRGPSNPDPSGRLVTLHGLTIVDAAVRRARPTPVAETGRHQTAIELARLRAGDEPGAVLVPGATRLFGRRLHVGVQLVTPDDRLLHAGFLPSGAEDWWYEELAGLQATGVYVQVPAVVHGTTRALAVDLDLGGLVDAIRSAREQQALS